MEKRGPRNRATIYARLNGLDGKSNLEMITPFLEHMCRRGYQLGERPYFDLKVSSSRSGLFFLLTDAMRAQFDVVVISHPAEISDDARDVIEILHLLEDCGVQVEVAGWQFPVIRSSDPLNKLFPEHEDTDQDLKRR